jgi:glycosyltransferase involved in cell wall biosynthesis
MATISVLIPAYNCAATIQLTLESVLRQTVVPNEILVMNDGSTDTTLSVLESYGSRIKVYSQPNSGVARTRNELVARATGEMIAFLDSDDLWHPTYLEHQLKLFHQYPQSVAFWTGHVNFRGSGDYEWPNVLSRDPEKVELIPALDFFRRYNMRTGPFSCFSYCCLRRKMLMELGSEPFKEPPTEDSYCCSLLALMGHPVIAASADLVAYRVREDSLSHDHSRSFGVWVRTFEILEDQFNRGANADLLSAFRFAHASKRRCYAKLLMGLGRSSEARAQLRKSVGNSHNPVSIAKSLALLSLTYMPGTMQPKWPSKYRG